MTTKSPQILELIPPIELSFQGPFSEVVTTKLTLRNPSNERVGFKVKTTAPKQYCVRPNSGVIPPHGEQEVSVMLQPMDEVAVAERTKHKFMVQSMCVDEGFNADDLDAAMKNADKRKLMDSKLKCLFLDAEDSTSEPTTAVKPESPNTSDEKSTMFTPARTLPNAEEKETTVRSSPEEPLPTSQPTAGSTPAHTTTGQINTESDQLQSEMRVLRDKAKKLAEENKILKTETDRLRQQYLAQSTSVKAPLKSAQNKNESSLNLIAMLLILVALVMGYFVGTYTS